MSEIATLIQTLAKGGPVMIPLLGCSIVALAVVIERLGFWWRQGDARVVEQALELAERGIEREPVEPGQLRARLQARARSEPDLAVVIEADTDVLHGRVVDVMDAARLAGVGRLAIAVTPRETRR